MAAPMVVIEIMRNDVALRIFDRVRSVPSLAINVTWERPQLTASRTSRNMLPDPRSVRDDRWVSNSCSDGLQVCS